MNTRSLLFPVTCYRNCRLALTLCLAFLASVLNLSWAATSGTATSPQDFLANGQLTGSLTIPTGQTSATFALDNVDDAAREALEQFTVGISTTFTNISYTGGVTSTTVRIASDDGLINFAEWMTAHGLSGNDALIDADPNRDGVSNIASWLHRINPAGPSPAAWLERRAQYVVTTGNLPALRFTVPLPLPVDVDMIFEETTTLTDWSEEVRRNGFGSGSTWSGTGLSRVTDTSVASGRVVTLGGSRLVSARSKTFLRMKYALIGSGDN